MKKIILLATTLYLLLASLTYHPDNKLVLNWASQDHGKVWNIWQYGEKHLTEVGQFNYPPLHFYLDKLQYAVAKPIGGNGFYEWLSTANSTDANQENLARYSLAMKITLIAFAMLVSYLLYLLGIQAGSNKLQAQTLGALWLFNPITIYSIPVMGQNDVMAIAFFLGGWYLLNKKKVVTSSILFGLGTSIKMFPLLWLPFLLLIDYRLKLKERIKTFILSSLVYIFTLLPFITNSIFRANAFNSGINRMFMAQISLGYGERFLIVPFLLMLLVVGTLKKHIKEKTIFNLQATLLLLLNMTLLFFNHFHPQWITWLVPFWTIFILQQKKKNFIPAILISISIVIAWLIIILLFNDSALSFGLFTISNPNLAYLPTIKELLTNHLFNPTMLNNYAHTWLAGITLILLMEWLTIQNGLTANFIKINFKVKLEKKISYPLVVLFLILLTSSIIFIAKIIPAPLTSKTPEIISYPLFTTSIQQTFIGKYNDLNRVDLFFSNTGLKNRDPYLLEIKNQDNKVISLQKFSGFNTGFKSILRFNLPPQTISKNQTYTITITPLKESESPLRIGATKSDNPDSFGIISYYQQPRGINLIKFAFKETFVKLEFLFKQLSIFYILLLIILWFAL